VPDFWSHGLPNGAGRFVTVCLAIVVHKTLKSEFLSSIRSFTSRFSGLASVYVRFFSGSICFYGADRRFSGLILFCFQLLAVLRLWCGRRLFCEDYRREQFWCTCLGWYWGVLSIGALRWAWFAGATFSASAYPARPILTAWAAVR